MRELTCPSPFGPLTIGESDGRIAALRWGGDAGDESELLDEAARQLADYFDGSRKAFDLPIGYRPGLQGQVMRAMVAIHGVVNVLLVGPAMLWAVHRHLRAVDAR